MGKTGPLEGGSVNVTEIDQKCPDKKQEPPSKEGAAMGEVPNQVNR